MDREQLKLEINNPLNTSMVIGYTSNRSTSERHYFVEIFQRMKLESDKYYIDTCDVEYFNDLIKKAERAKKRARELEGKKSESVELDGLKYQVVGEVGGEVGNE